MIRPAIRPIADQTDVALVLGRGGHAAVVVDALHAVGAVVLGALDDDPDPRAATPPDVTRLGRLDDLDAVLDAHPEITLVHAAVGDPHTRERWLARIDDARLRPIVHPSAVVSPSATLGAACFIGARAIVQAHASIGRATIVNTGAIVEHDARVGTAAHIAPGAILAGAVTVGARTLVGVGACVIPRVIVGDDATVGAGAAVTADVPSGLTVVGVPARAVGTRIG